MPRKSLYNLEGKSVWVAGETGMVGRALLSRLESENVRALSAPHKDLDLTDQAQTYAWLAQNKPDVVFMAAAKVGGIGANEAAPADFLYENLSMTQNVIHGAYQAGVQKLLYLGSSCIYPKYADQPIREEALLTGALEPTNEAYAVAKIAGVKMCESYRAQYGCDFISAMPTNLYGPNDHFDAQNSHVIPALILKIHQAKINGDLAVELWGTGTPLREFLYVDDLADGVVHILKHYSDKETINIGSGFEASIANLAREIASVIGYGGEIKFDPEKPDGTPRKLLDSGKLQAMGWGAKTPLQQGLEATYQWYLNHLPHGE